MLSLQPLLLLTRTITTAVGCPTFPCQDTGVLLTDMPALRGHFGNCVLFKTLQNLPFLPHLQSEPLNSCLAIGWASKSQWEKDGSVQKRKEIQRRETQIKVFYSILVGQVSIWQLEFMWTLPELISQGLADLGNVPEVIFSLRWAISGHFSNVLNTNIFFLTLEWAQLLVSVLSWMGTIYSYCSQGHLHSCPLARIHIFPAKLLQ